MTELAPSKGAIWDEFNEEIRCRFNAHFSWVQGHLTS